MDRTINDTQLLDDDFVIRIRPFKDKAGKWNGEVDLSVVTLPDNSYDDDDYSQLIHFCSMVAATVPIMEMNEEMREQAHEFVSNLLDEPDTNVVQDTGRVIDRKDNVITIGFGTTTKGSA
jgi:hypothetical protein